MRLDSDRRTGIFLSPAAPVRPDAGRQRGRNPDGAVMTTKRRATVALQEDVRHSARRRGAGADRLRTPDRRDSGERVADHALLADRHPDSSGHPAREAGRVRRGDCADTVCTIERRVRTGVLQEQPGLDGPVRRAFPRRTDCRRHCLDNWAGATSSSSSRSASPTQRDFYAEMCRVERWSVAHLAPADRRHALRAHRALQEARQADREGADRAPRRTAS